jgi:hypothetical protein
MLFITKGCSNAVIRKKGRHFPHASYMQQFCVVKSTLPPRFQFCVQVRVTGHIGYDRFSVNSFIALFHVLNIFAVSMK